MPRKRIQTIILCALAALAWQLTQNPVELEEPKASETDILQTYLHDSEIVRFDTSGKALDSIAAAEVRYYAGRELGELDLPKVARTINIDESWSVRADRGYIDQASQQVRLEGDVLLSHDRNDLQLASERLDLDLRTDIAQTNSTVELTQRNGRTQANGLKADLNKQIFEFLSEVNSTYVPSNSDK